MPWYEVGGSAGVITLNGLAGNVTLAVVGGTIAASGSTLTITVSPGVTTWDALQGKPSVFPPSAHGHVIGDVTGLQTALDGKQAAGSYAAASHTHTSLQITDFATAVASAAPPTTNAGLLTSGTLSDARLSANVPILVAGVLPSAYLPSFVDDVLEAATLSAFPATGETGKIYVARDTNRTYRWSGSTYIEISASPGSTDAVSEGSINLYFTTARASAAAPVQSVAGRNGAVTLAKADVGLGSVDNTADASKPVSTAQASANAAVQAYAVQRGNHTGTQLASTITDFAAAAVTAVTWTTITGKPSTFPPSAHTHAISEVTGLQTTLDGKQTAGSYVLTTDSRLTDAREWSAATVTQSQAEAGTDTGRLAFTVLRVWQAIAAWWAASSAKSKLDGIATGATANQTDSYLLARANHTGSQSYTTITGLGGAATLSVGTTAGTVAAGDDSRIVGALNAATAATTYQPLDSDLTSIAALTTTTFGRSLLTQTDAAATRTTIGLGSLATQSGTFSGTSSGTNTGDQTITLTGDVTGSGAGSFAVTLAASGVTAGTYTSVTVDAKGRVTGGTPTQAWSTITSTPTTLSGYGITDAAASSHTHGNLTNAGAIGSTSGQIVVTTTSGVLTTVATISAATQVSGLAAVATSGSYADLSGKPTTFAPSTHASTHQTGGADPVASVVVTPTSLAADQNDWAIGTGDIFRVAGTAARNVTGIVAGTSGQAVLLVNVGSFALTLKHQSASSTAANRFTVPWAGDCVLAASVGAVVLVYDSTSSTWRVVF